MNARFADSHDKRTESVSGTGISRRSFVAAGCASALSFFLPSIASFGNAVAYAIETGTVDEDGQPEFDIYVITREEIGLSVVDVSNNAKTPVAGASVTLVSSKTNATATATTDENGLAVFNLKTSNLGVPMKLEGIGNGYRFEGSIKTVVPGQSDTWMDFETGRLRADGGTAIQTPLRQKANLTDPYFVTLSFDGWDILYTGNGVVSTTVNTDDHTFVGKLYAPNASSVKIELIARTSEGKDTVVFTKNVAVSNGFAQFSQTARYLFIYKGNKDLLPDECDYLYRATIGKTAYIVTTKFSVRQAPVPEPVYLTASMTPDAKSLGSFSLPSDIPSPLGGSSLSIWCPSFPFMGWMSPQGYGFFAGTLSSDFTNSAPCTNQSEWKNETCGSAKSQFESLVNTWGNSLDKIMSTSNLLDPSASVKDKFSMSNSLSIDVTAQIYVLAEWDFAKKLWRATLNGLVIANLGFTFTARTTVGPVPLFLTFALKLGGKVSASIGVETIDFKTIDIPQTSGLAFTVTISVALTLGVGAPGVASVGLRGSGFITSYVSFLDTSGKVPHLIVGFGLAADIVVQMLLFTWTGKLWSYKKDRLYDNASYGLLQDVQPDLTLNPTDYALGTDDAGAPLYSHTAPFDPMKGLDLAEFIRQSTIVTENDLNKTKEVRGIRTANAALLSEANEPSITLLDNGIAVVDLSDTNATADIAATTAEAASEFAYEYIGEDLDEVCDAVGGVAGIAATGGVTPTVDKKIATRIFSHPNCKVVVFLDTPYLFRIISVDYQDDGTTKTRTRLAVQKMNSSGKWSTPTVLEFSRFTVGSVKRIDTFDYDFDVYANDSASTGYLDSGLCIMLLSGTRPQGDETDFLSVSNSTIMTIGFFDGYFRCKTSYTWKDVPGSDSAPYQALLLPRIAPVSAGGSNVTTTGLALLYLRRTANSPESVFGNEANVTAEFFYYSAQQLFTGAHEQIDPSTYDLTIFSNSERDTDEASFSFAIQSDAGMSITSVFPVGAKALAADGAASANAMPVFTIKHNIVNALGLENSRPWPRHSAILVPDNGVLTALSFDPAVEGGAFEKTKIGPEDAKITTFAVSPSGNALFYLVNQEGDAGQAYDENGNPTSTEKASLHTIYACSCIDGLFSKPFPLANVNHAIDALENAYVGTTYSFVTTCITSMASKSADIYFINVPVTATATPLGFVAENSFVCAGGADEPFLMELRNDGNVILTGCTVELRDADLPEPGNVVDTRTGFRFESAILAEPASYTELLASESAENGAGDATGNGPTYSAECLEALGIGEDHVLVNPDATGSLLPGDSGQYRIRFNIPESWKSGHKNVYITCKDFTYNMVTVGSEVGSVLQHPTSLEADNAPEVSISIAQPSGSDPLGDALLAPEGSAPSEEGGTETGGGTTGGSATGGGINNAGAGKGSHAAATGDQAPATLAGVALAAAVAGITAYSIRRHAVEHEQRETREIEDDD